MMNPAASVIIATFNRRAMVSEAIESVLAQRDACFELIVVDDGSTDGSWDEIDRIAAIVNASAAGGASMRVARITHGGVARARNTGAAIASTPLLAFLDSDDLWARDKLARQIEFMRSHPGCAISQTDEIWMRNGVRVNPGVRHRKRAGDIFAESLLTCLISPSAAIMRTAIFRGLGGFDENFLAAEDYDLWLRILARHEAGLLDLPLVTRRAGHPGQLSATVAAIDRFRITALLKLLAGSELSPERRILVCDVLADKCAIYASGLTRRGFVDSAGNILKIAQRAASWRQSGDAGLAEALSVMRKILQQQWLLDRHTEASQ